MFGYKLVKVEKPEKEKTEAEETTKEGEEKGEKKMKKKGKIALWVAVGAGALGAAAAGAKMYIDSKKEDSYASLDQANVEDEAEDLDQEDETTSEEEAD